MTDIEKAKKLLIDENLTIALVKDNYTQKSTLRGISPMVDFLSNGIDLSGYSLADKVVGSAAAMLFVLAGVSAVYAKVITRAAVLFLEENKISVEYEILCDNIINRRGDDICPMEKAVKNIKEPTAAFKAIKLTLKTLKTMNV